MIRYAYKELAENWLAIFRKLKINVIIIPEERCCGSPLKNAGAKGEFEENAEKLSKILEKYHVGEIIAACPACAYTLSSYLDVPVKHTTQVILEKIEKVKLKPLNMKVCYHDPCHLARYLEIFNEPREILAKCSCKVVDIEFSKKMTYCCGGGGGLPANHPEVAEIIVKNRIEQLQSREVDGIVTSCPMCYHQLRKYASKPVYELSHLLARALEVKTNEGQ